MLYRIDFHCHSTASDGMLTIPELVELAYNRGLNALVVTDHCSPFGSYFQNKQVVDTLKKMGHHFKVPVIVGCEIATPYSEFLLFGHRAIVNWYAYKEKLKKIRTMFGIEFYWEAFWTYVLHSGNCSFGGGTDRDGEGYLSIQKGTELPYAMIMCHPTDKINFLDKAPQRMFDCIHGFEINNGGIDYEEEYPNEVVMLRSKIRHPRELKNSDCHGEELAIVSNEINLPDHKELNEGNIISWLRNKK